MQQALQSLQKQLDESRAREKTALEMVAKGAGWQESDVSDTERSADGPVSHEAAKQGHQRPGQVREKDQQFGGAALPETPQGYFLRENMNRPFVASFDATGSEERDARRRTDKPRGEAFAEQEETFPEMEVSDWQGARHVTISKNTVGGRRDMWICLDEGQTQYFDAQTGLFDATPMYDCVDLKFHLRQGVKKRGIRISIFEGEEAIKRSSASAGKHRD